MTNWRKYVFSTFIFLITLEILLRILGVNQTYSEKSGFGYQSLFISTNRDWFHTWNPNETVNYVNDEFTYINKYNDLGHRDINFSEFVKDTSNVKYVFLGDSFTEGDGAPQDSSYVRFYSDLYKQNIDSSFLAYNAGVCGSDVYFNYIMLKEKLLISKPNAVIECINNTDISDIYYYGGMERYGADGKLTNPKVKKWELLYHYSYLFRILLHTFSSYSDDLTTESGLREAELLMYEQIERTDSLCKANGIKYYPIIMPVPLDLDETTEQVFPQINGFLPNHAYVSNIFPCMQTFFKSHDLEEYYWYYNCHFNGKGYKVQAQCVFDAVENR